MNRQELKCLLECIAEEDVSQGSNIGDHPCPVAIMAIDKAFDEVNILRKLIPNGSYSKKVNMIIGLNYDPKW